MTTPDHMLAAAWDRFAEGVAPGKSAWSMLYVATVGLDGAPRVRTVVIRALDEVRKSLRFNTDLRSPKAAEIAAEPRVTVLGYDSFEGFQVRIEGLATVHTSGAVRDEAWTATADRSRVCYRHAFAPGASLAAPELGDPTAEMKSPDDRDTGLENFGAVEVVASRIDVLDLAARGHRRACFTAEADWKGEWIAP